MMSLGVTILVRLIFKIRVRFKLRRKVRLKKNKSEVGINVRQGVTVRVK